MKTLFAIGLILIIGCDRPRSKVVYPIYEYSTQMGVPDSLKQQQAEWIKETIRAADQHLGAGDYEDPEDVVEEISETSEILFGRQLEGLKITRRPEEWSVFFPYSQLDEKQKEIFNKLK